MSLSTMLPAVDQQKMAESLAYAVGQLPKIFDLGQNAAPHIDGVHLISCGSGFDGAEGIEYFSQPISKMPVKAFYSSDYICNTPATTGRKTLAVVISKKGTTEETIEAARFLNGKVYKTLCITQNEASEFSSLVDETFLLGNTAETFVGIYMLMLCLVGGIWEINDGWKLGEKLLRSCKAFPAAFAAAAAHDDQRALFDAARLQGVAHVYLIGSGSGMINANVAGPCIMTEAHKIPTQPVPSGKVGHGMMEVFKKQTTLMLIHTEDRNRAQTKGLGGIFKDEGLKNVLTYDARDYEMKGVDPEIRPFLGAFAIQAFLKRVLAYLAEMNGTDTKQRTYMGRIKFWRAVKGFLGNIGLSI